MAEVKVSGGSETLKDRCKWVVINKRIVDWFIVPLENVYFSFSYFVLEYKPVGGMTQRQDREEFVCNFYAERELCQSRKWVALSSIELLPEGRGTFFCVVERLGGNSTFLCRRL